MNPLAALVEGGLLYLVMPIWLAAGFADFACHRVMRIEYSAGLRESLLHLLMVAQLGVAVLCPLLLTPTTAVFAVMLAACIAHEATTLADLAYAESRRRIPWFEQWVHALQQALPWMWLAGWMLVAAPQALALFGAGDEAAGWILQSRQPGLSAAYLASVLGGAVVLVLLPLAYEWWRCQQVAGGPGITAPMAPAVADPAAARR